MTRVKISSVLGNSQKLDGGSMYGNAPRTVWEKWSPPDDLGRIDLACRAMLVEIGETKVLCETGIGAFFEPKLAERYGVQDSNRHVLLESLDKLGLKHEDIDYVILSHLHFDHAGGLLPVYGEQQRLLFSKAIYLVGEEAWKRARQPHARDRASFIPEVVELLEQSGRLKIISDKADIPSDLQKHVDFFYSDGHTPGQALTIINGAQRRVVFCGDLVPGRAWMHVPITMGYDRYPEKLIDEKQELYQSLLHEKDILFFTHDTSLAGTTFSVDEKGKVLAKQTWPSFERFEI